MALDKSFLEEVKNKLLTNKKVLVSQLEEMTHEKEFNKDRVQVKWKEIGDKDEDNAVEVANFQDNISLERELEENLEKIDDALAKIEKGGYGICESCGQEIARERLLAFPEAAKCLACASKK